MDWNESGRAFFLGNAMREPPATLHEMFHRSAIAFKDLPAVLDRGRCLEYRELDALRDHICRLVVNAARDFPAASVALICDRGIPAYAGLLGILSAGRAYVPIDRSTPPARLVDIVRAANIRVLIVDFDLADQVRDILSCTNDTYIIIGLDSDGNPSPNIGNAGGSKHIEAADSYFDGKGVAYIMFTSGSTGAPKGVPILHCSIMPMLESLRGRIVIHSNDRVSQFTNLTFDVSVAELFLCWSSGACVCPPTLSERFDPMTFVDRNGVTVWSSVPTLAEIVRARAKVSKFDASTLRISMFAGEAMSLSLAKFWEELAPNSEIYNLYGPTEAAVYATIYKFDGQDVHVPDPLPLGEPLETVKTLELREDGIDVSELLLAGPQVFSGYLGPLSDSRKEFYTEDSSTESWYKTGDLVSHSQSYGLLFHGRRDRQIKLRGFRVEMQEIESAIRATAKIRAAVVPLFGENGGAVDLVAFMADGNLTEAEIRRHCQARLPDYMIPRYFWWIPDLPLNANGKTDYKALEAKAAQIASSPSPRQGKINE